MNTDRRMAVAAALFAATGFAFAQVWPSKPVRFVVPFPPGGPLDAVARTIGQAVQSLLGQPIVIENKPGALGSIGTEAVARAPADGYTVLFGFSGGHSLTPATMALRYDPIKELPPVIGVARSELVLVSGRAAKGAGILEFIQRAKERKENTVGGIGTGSTNHLVGELFKRATGISGTHVPYQGAAPLALAVMSGEVDLAVLDVGAVLTHIQAGNMAALAVASAARSRFLPDVPTLAEAGVPGIAFENVYGVFAPSGTPREAVDKLAESITGAIASTPVKEQFTKFGLLPVAMPRAELDAAIRAQAAALVPIANELKIRNP
jgi:tripartite-type tricarboxylate transporter receptor subunit TctC